MFRLKISQADKYFSLFIRHRDCFTCQRCLRYYEPPTQAIHCSHFHGRGKKSVRFDQENACALCYGCHRYVTAHPQEHRDFFLKRLGQVKYDALNLRANIPTKVDEKLMALYWKKELKDNEWL